MNAITTYTHFAKGIAGIYYDMMKDTEKDTHFIDMKKNYIGSKQFKKNKRNNKKRGIK